MGSPASSTALNALARCVRTPHTAHFECTHMLRTTAKASTRRMLSATASPREQDTTVELSQKPRYAHTPERMRAPFSLRKPKPNNQWPVNEDPQKLDAVYRAVLGESGDKLLTDEVKWLAVTHKSFDQGRRGYNDRLAFLGKQIVSLQASLALLNSAEHAAPLPVDPFQAQRQPFQHPAVDLLPRLTVETRKHAIDNNRIAQLASDYGLAAVVRWKPRRAGNLLASGSETVLAQALYAIIGALALQRGGEVAVGAVKKRILSRLGLQA